MNEQQRMLTDTIERLFPDLAAHERGHGARPDFGAGWERVRELALCDLLLPEGAGGFGGSWQDARILMHAAGEHALALPVAETMLARQLLQDTGIAVPEAPITLAGCSAVQAQGSGLRVELRNVPWGSGEACVLTAFAHEGAEYLALYDSSAARHCRRRDGVGAEARADLELDGSALVASCRRENACDTLLMRGALLRATQAGGALAGALALTTAHANDRVQFGRALAKFQVIQHQLALLAEETAAVSCAAGAACLSLDTAGDTELAIACAKLRANRAVHQATSIAHQLHGAIGFTREHALHHFTQRLWAWRSEFGNDRYWAGRLGREVARAGAGALWPRITG